MINRNDFLVLVVFLWGTKNKEGEKLAIDWNVRGSIFGGRRRKGGTGWVKGKSPEEGRGHGGKLIMSLLIMPLLIMPLLIMPLLIMVDRIIEERPRV